MAVITVGVRFEGGAEYRVRSQFEHPVVLEPTPECHLQFPTGEDLFRCCEGSAMSGVFYATRHCRDSCGEVLFTRFEGVLLPPDCGTGFAVAAALACARALGEEARKDPITMDGWEDMGADQPGD